MTDNADYVPKGFVDSEDSSGNLICGSGSMIAQDESDLQPLGRVGSNHYSNTAKTVREKFSAFFSTAKRVHCHGNSVM